VDDAGHNDLAEAMGEDYWRTIREFVRRDEWRNR